MNRQKFMNELEALLRDIPENDRLDAIAYYHDYFDEAGKENEELVLRELGSPKKVADTIKAGLAVGEDFLSEESTVEFSERGCMDRRSAEEWKAPMTAAFEHQQKRTNQKSESSHTESAKEIATRFQGKMVPWPVIVLLLIFASPILIGIIAGLFGGLIGLLGGLFGVTVGTAGSGFGLFIGGLVCLVTGFVRTFSNPLEGMTSMGVGALLTSVGILLLLLLAVLIKKWIPALVKGFIGGCKYVYRWAMGLLRRDEV